MTEQRKIGMVSQLILRNAEQFRTGQVLLINPPRDSCCSRLSQDQQQVSVFSQDFADYNYLNSSGAKAEFGLIPSVASTAQDIVLILPRERERLEMLLHALSSSMPPQSILWLAGENRSGIKSSVQRLRAYFQTVSKVDSARHSTLLRACNPTALDPFDLESYKKTWPLIIEGAQINIVSLPGTFAHGRLDRGTRLLLDTLKELKPAGQVLDFACGSGVIGLSLLHLHPATVLTLLEVSAPALESARHSLRVNGMEATVLASDGLSHLEGRFDWIISNPPFHRGIQNDLDIARNFFAHAGKFLVETGKILLVCNLHLPYPAWLRDYFTRVEVVRTDWGFKVILATGIR
ncbi:MAG: methyltransferase [Proteobacteria bacterium]|nr:methyltransferase [Pseudomonadota bacterium]